MSYHAKAKQTGTAPVFLPEEWAWIKQKVQDADSIVSRLLGIATWQRCKLALELEDELELR